MAVAIYNNIEFIITFFSFIQFVISIFVTPWDNPTVPPGINFPTADNIEIGKALLGVVIHPNAKGASMNVTPDTLKKLIENGTL